MTVATARRAPIRRPPSRSEDRLAALLTDLGALEVHARVLAEDVVGERDVRVQAWRDGGEVLVELLWCGPDAPVPMQLDAVRVCGQRREVWRSPSWRCLPADAVRFLCDLLLLDEDALPRRYLLLG